MTTEDERRRLAEQIADRSAKARGVIVSDGNLAGLAAALREPNLTVYFRF